MRGTFFRAFEAPAAPQRKQSQPWRMGGSSKLQAPPPSAPAPGHNRRSTCLYWGDRCSCNSFVPVVSRPPLLSLRIPESAAIYCVSPARSVWSTAPQLSLSVAPNRVSPPLGVALSCCTPPVCHPRRVWLSPAVPPIVCHPRWVWLFPAVPSRCVTPAGCGSPLLYPPPPVCHPRWVWLPPVPPVPRVSGSSAPRRTPESRRLHRPRAAAREIKANWANSRQFTPPQHGNRLKCATRRE